MLGPKTTLTLQTPTETNTAYGLTTSWSSEGSIVGVLTKSKDYLRSNTEREISGRILTTSTHTFFCDNFSYTITTKKRFVLDSRVFNIVQVYNPGNMNHHLEIELVEIT